MIEEAYTQHSDMRKLAQNMEKMYIETIKKHALINKGVEYDY